MADVCRGGATPRAHHRLAAAAQGARRDPDSRRTVRHQGHQDRPARQADPSHARIEVRADSAERLERNSRRHPRPRGHPGPRRPTARRSPPTSTGRSPKASTARPTSAPRCGSAANGSTWRTRKWTAASSIDADGAGSPVRADDRRPTRAIRSSSAAAGVRVFPDRGRAAARTCSSSWPRPVSSEKPEGGDASARSPRRCGGPRSAARRSWPCSARRSSTPAAASGSAG